MATADFFIGLGGGIYIYIYLSCIHIYICKFFVVVVEQANHSFGRF